MNHTLLPKVVIRAITPFFKGIASFNILQVFRRIQSNHIFSPLLSFIFLFLFNTTSQAQCGNNNVLVSGSLTPPGVGKTKTLSFKTGEYVLAYCEAGASYTISACKSQYYTDAQISVYSDLGGNLLAYNDDYCGLLPQVTFTSQTCQYVRVLLDKYYCYTTGELVTLEMTQNTPSNTLPNMDQPENRTVCPNDSTAPIVFSSSIQFGKLTYRWTNDNPNIGLADSGTGNIPSFVPINTSSQPITARITVSLTHQYDTIICTGLAMTFTITVNPTNPASFTGLDSSYCQNASSVTLTGTPSGGYFLVDGYYIYSSTLYPSSLSVGRHTMQYFNSNACPTTSPIKTFEIKPVPYVSITGLNSILCKSDTATIILQGTPAGGVFTIDGVKATVLNPSLLSVGYHSVQYSYTNSFGCTGSTVQNVEIRDAVPASFTGLDSIYCQNASFVPLTGTPSGGYFLVDGYSYYGVYGTIFNPSYLGVGRHTMQYINSYAACPIGSPIKTFEIKPVPYVSIIGLNSLLCKSDTTTIILQGTPADGVFTIDGVRATVLNPSLLSVGYHSVQYSYTNSFGCMSSTVQNIEIRDAAPASFTGLDSIYCQNASSVPLTGTPSGGYFLVDGYSYNGVYSTTFYPSHLGVGRHTMQYINSYAACPIASPIKTFEIKPVPSVSITGLNSILCKSDTATIILQGTPAGGVFTIDGAKATVLNPSSLSVGYHSVQYSYTDSFGCTGSTVRNIEIRDAVPASFAGLDSIYCQNASSVPLIGTPSGGYFLLDGYYSYYYDRFYLSSFSVGRHTIQYINPYAACPVASPVKTFEIKPVPSVSITGLNSILCKSDTTTIILQGIPVGGVFTIDSVKATVLNPALLSVGYHSVRYSYTDSFGCMGSTVQNIEIRDAAPASFSGLDSIYCQNASSVTLTGTPSGGYFLVDGYSYNGIYETTFYPSYLSVGSHTVQYINSNACPIQSPPKIVNIVRTPSLIVPSDIRAINSIGRCGSPIIYYTLISGGYTQTSYTFSGATTGQGTGNGSGSFFNTGVTLVTVTVQNKCAVISRSFRVTVIDTEKPTITCPANQNIILGGFECNRVVSFNDPSVSDGCSVSFRRIDTLTQIQSGSSLSAGVYDFKYRATDNSGNTSDCTFKITVNSQNSTATRLNCIPNMTVSLDSKQCYNSIEPAQLLTDGNYYCSSLYSVSISSRDGDGTIPKNYITKDDLGKTIIAAVKNNFNQSCTTAIAVIDRQAPVLSALQDTLLLCSELNNGKVLATLSQPNIIYECSKVNFSYQDKVLSPSTGQTGFTALPDNFPRDKSFDYGTGSQSSRIIIRTYTATDEYNNSSTVQRVIYVKNINLSDVVCPKDMTLQCENGNFDASITVTGTPQLSNSGRSLQDVSCAIDYFYSDEKESTLQGYTLKRAWTLIKRGTQERQVCTQTIIVVCNNTPLSSISGSINKETGESVSATVKLSNSTTELSQQEGSTYNFSNLGYADLYRVRAERDNDVLNGVTTFDISRISKHILGLEALTSPYQMIAADVNKDGNIDGTDIIYIRNVLLKRLSRFPNNSSWRFVPKNYTFTDASNPFNEDFPEMLSWNPLNQNVTQGDFVAIKIGDVNLSSQSNIQAPVERSQNVQYIDIQDFKISAGEEYTLNLNLNERSLTALQMALKVNKTHLDLLKVNKGDLPQFDNSNIELNEDKAFIASVWYNSSNADLKDENTLIRLTVKPKKAIWVHDLLVIDSDEMMNVAYNTEGVEKTLELRFKAAEIQSPNFELHQNRPNPFSQETKISFVLPEGGVASLEVYDLMGRTVYSVKKTFTKGYNEVVLSTNELPTASTYFYRLQSDSYSATKKMQVGGH